MAYTVKDFIRNPLSLKASVVWSGFGSLIVLGFLVAALVCFTALKVAAQEDPFADPEFTGPVAEGDWMVPDDGVTICPIFAEPGKVTEDCLHIQDQWGPYPDEAMCNRRMDQMGAQFPLIATSQFGIPFWAMVTSCEKAGTAI